MNKWYGKIGYNGETVEAEPGVWKPQIIERPYFGDIIRNSRMFQQNTNSTNDNINISNQISVVADPYAYQNFHSMLYVEFMDALWKVTNVDATQQPRLILTLGGLYNGAGEQA